MPRLCWVICCGDRVEHMWSKMMEGYMSLHSIQAISGSSLLFMLSAKTPGGDPRHKKL